MATYTTREVRAFRLPRGVELVTALTRYCTVHKIQQACISGMGALHDPELGSYSFEEGTFGRLKLEGDWELLVLNANVSLKDGAPFIHPHVVLGDPQGNVRGGHLFAAEVHVAEIYVHVMAGQALSRVPDDETGLQLWKAEAL